VDQADPGRRRHVTRERADGDDVCHQARRRGPSNEEYAKDFPTNKPARTTVTAALNPPALLIEITVTACIPS
jgi:enamine deaminase RidA (YjgF/YER057c/UK114 family)